jgi:hypothetical protein
LAAVPIASQTRIKKKSGAGAGFLRVLLFPLSICIPQISPQSPSSIIRCWYNRPVVAAVSKVPQHKLKTKNNASVLLMPSRGFKFNFVTFITSLKAHHRENKYGSFWKVRVHVLLKTLSEENVPNFRNYEGGTVARHSR